MNTPARLAAFAAALVAVFALAFVVGDAVGPLGTPADQQSPAPTQAPGEEATPDVDHSH